MTCEALRARESEIGRPVRDRGVAEPVGRDVLAEPGALRCRADDALGHPDAHPIRAVRVPLARHEERGVAVLAATEIASDPLAGALAEEHLSIATALPEDGELVRDADPVLRVGRARIEL